MSWIDKIIPAGVRKADGDAKANIPEGLWRKCAKCDAVLYRPDLERNAEVYLKLSNGETNNGKDYRNRFGYHQLLCVGT